MFLGETAVSYNPMKEQRDCIRKSEVMVIIKLSQGSY